MSGTMMTPPPTPNAPEKMPPMRPTTTRRSTWTTGPRLGAGSGRVDIVPHLRGAPPCTVDAVSPTDRRDSAWSRPLVRAWVATIAGVILLAIAVLAARWFRDQPFGADFVAAFPGETTRPPGTPAGFPAWLAWQHFL